VSTPDLDEFFFVALLTSKKKIWRVSGADRHKQQKMFKLLKWTLLFGEFFRATAYEQVHLQGFRVS